MLKDLTTLKWKISIKMSEYENLKWIVTRGLKKKKNHCLKAFSVLKRFNILSKLIKILKLRRERVLGEKWVMSQNAWSWHSLKVGDHGTFI